MERQTAGRLSEVKIEEMEVLDFDKICRICLMEKGTMLRIFALKKRNNRTPLPIRIMSCTSLEIFQGDGLPSKICSKCLWEVNQSYAFRERCEASNLRLLEYVHLMKTKGDSDSPGPNKSETNTTVSKEMDANIDEKVDLKPIWNDQTELKNEAIDLEDCKFECKDDDDEDDDKPISQLFLRNHHPHNVEDSISHDLEDDLEETVEGGGTDSGDVEDSESDLDAEPAAALVETEMAEEDKCDADASLSNSTIINTPRPMSVRKFLEAQFGPESSFGQQKHSYSTSEYSKIKKKQKSPTVLDKTVAKPGRYGRDGWEPFNVLDLKPRKKYAPREKNLISNNSSPIIEQDGTKSKFRACMHCGKVVLGKNMGIHVKIHVGNKSHLCDICGKSFLYKKTLETHKRVHSGERPCVCKICDKTFRSSSRLSDHMSTHTGRKPFICEICAVAFRIKGHLKKHLRVHSGEKPYVCSFCEKAFSDAWNMKCHLRIHTGEKPPHACPVCGQCFLRRNKMEEHCKMTHGEEYVLPRKQNLVQHLKNDLVEMNEQLRIIADRERDDMIRQEAERQLLANHFESQRLELADQLGISVPLPIALPVPAFPGNIPAGIFGL